MLDWLGIAVRFGLYLDLMAALGLAVFAATNPHDVARAIPLGKLLGAAAAAGLLLSLLGLAVQAAGMAGVPLSEVDRETVGMVLSGTALGRAWMVRMVALLVLATVALVAERPGVSGLASVAALVAAATLAWAGHGVMDEGGRGWLHLSADIVHLVAAGVWVGALLALVLLLWRPVDRIDAAHLRLSHAALHGFSTTGTLVVLALVVTGLVNGWLLVGPSGVPALFATLYGRLLLAKLALFVLMLGLASANRFRLTPALERRIGQGDCPGAVAALRRSLAVETASAVLILALVAWLGTLEPIASI